MSVSGSFIFVSKLLRSDPETKVYEQLLSDCLRYILPLFVQINFHSSFFLILFTAPNFRKGVRDSPMYTFFSAPARSCSLKLSKVEAFRPATDFHLL